MPEAWLTNALACGRIGWNVRVEEPDTIEEWYNVLVAFKEQDPNGNNKKDEIPVIAINTNGLYKLAWSYGPHLYLSEGWYPNEDGKIVQGG